MAKSKSKKAMRKVMPMKKVMVKRMMSVHPIRQGSAKMMGFPNRPVALNK